MTVYVETIPETDITQEIEIGIKSNCYVLAQGEDLIYLDVDMVDELITALEKLPLPEGK